MTDRAEIERLLNQTGRTLEGLPKEYPGDRCRAVGRAHGLTPAVAGNSLLHQSDVIELLVAALRDALDKQPKWISVKERLPEAIAESGRVKTTETVFAMDSCGAVHVGYFTVYKYDGSNVFHGVDVELFDDSPSDITHWMPLPSAEGLK